MKNILIFGIVSVFIACSSREPKPSVSYFELICRDRGGLSGGIDTLATLHHHSEQDTLIGEITFGFGGAEHVVRGWSNDHHAPVDGGSFWLELDSLGSIYGHSTTWPGFSVVRSDNDSINELIMMAMGAASRPGRFGLRCPLPPEPKIETVHFTAVDRIDQN